MSCKYCGQVLRGNENECPNCKHILEMNNFNRKKKGHNGILFIIILLLLGVIIGGYYYVNSPKTVFNTLLSRVYKTANKEMQNYKQMKVNLGFNVDIDAGEEYKEITDLINDFKINSSVNYDLTTQKLLLGLSAEYENKLLAEVDMYYEDSTVYVDLKNLFNKLIKVDIEEAEEIDITEKDINVISSTMFNALKETLNVAEYTSNKVKVDDTDVNKNVIIINNNNKDILTSTYVDYLLNSDEYITAISKISQITKEEVINELKDSKKTEDLEEEFQIAIYTKMLTNEFIKLEVSYGGNVTVVFKLKNNDYIIELYSEDGTKSEIVIKNDNVKTNMTFDMNIEGITAKINVDIEYIFNEKFQMPLTKESVYTDQITAEDTEMIYQKIMENEGIIEIVERITSLFPEEEPEIEDEGILQESVESTVKMVAAQVENQYTVAQTLGKEFAITGSCMKSWAGLNTNDYKSCSYSIDDKAEATVVIEGKGKYASYKHCEGTRSSIISCKKNTN